MRYIFSFVLLVCFSNYVYCQAANLTYEQIGEKFFRQGKKDSSVFYFLKSIKVDTNNSRSYAFLACIAYDEKSYKACIKYASKALAIDSLESTALINRGYAYFNLKMYDKAIVDLYKFERTGEKNPDLYSVIAYLERAKKNYNAALKYYLLNLTDKPNDADANNSMAWLYFVIGEPEKGLPFINKALKIKSNNPKYLDTRSCIYYKLKEYKKAIKDFTKVLIIVGPVSNSHFYRGLCYFDLKMNREACSDWKKVIEDRDYIPETEEKDVQKLIKDNCQ